jgi:hypothetical protein
MDFGISTVHAKTFIFSLSFIFFIFFFYFLISSFVYVFSSFPYHIAPIPKKLGFRGLTHYKILFLLRHLTAPAQPPAAHLPYIAPLSAHFLLHPPLTSCLPRCLASRPLPASLLRSWARASSPSLAMRVRRLEDPQRVDPGAAASINGA